MIFEKKILAMYRGMMYTRCDDCETVFYYSHEDFPGLLRESYRFTSSLGHSMQGYVYKYEGASEERLLVFDHGFGGGHRAYMKEIERLCRHGYRVLAYDHSGCMESGGETTGGLAASLRDLDDCMCAIEADPRFAGCAVSVMGHSWGAFSTMNIAALHPKITHIVAMCGFVSVEEMLKSFFSGLMRGYRGAVLALEREASPRYADFHAVTSLRASGVKALLIYSDNDRLCTRTHYDILKRELSDRENTELLLVSNKGHNPNYTEDAVVYLAAFGRERGKLLRKKHVSAEEKAAFVASFDWGRMTAQDETVFARIFDHLDS